MDEDFKFTWETMSLCFPEWKANLLKTDKFENYFAKHPDFSNNQINFQYKGDYGIQIFLNQKMPDWTPKESEVYKMLSKMNLESSKRLYEKTLGELDESFDILESWRKFVVKYNGKEWEGNLSNHLDFENEGNTVSLWDYYRFYNNSDCKDNSPTGILRKIKKLPRDSLNETWKKYAELAKDTSKNAITGRTLGECIKNADEIYKIAQELKALNLY
jgi:hypothetical protein